jgi:hypothetical protein
MTEKYIDLQKLVTRVEKLESQKNKRRLLGILIVIIALTSGFSVNTLTPLNEIVAEKFSLVDKNGKTRLKMELENGVTQITMNYENGDPCLRISGDKLCFYDQEKKARIKIEANNTLNSSCLSITDPSGKSCVTLSAGHEGPYLCIEDNEEQREVVLGINPIGSLDLIERSSGSERLPRAKVTCPPKTDPQALSE